MSMRHVWVDDWQMQCCGDAFSVGSTVEWSAYPVTDRDWYSGFLDAELVATITDHEEHHSDVSQLARLRGVVESIGAVFCHYRLVGQMATPIAGSGFVEQRDSADGWEMEGELGEGPTFAGYLVMVAPLSS